VLAVATLFGDLWPNVMPSSTSAAFSLTVANASSAHYTLVVMSWVALLFTPVVLAYQGWTYWTRPPRPAHRGRRDLPAAVPGRPGRATVDSGRHDQPWV
jgi:Cytochrome bd terminal oxidase subunit II